MSSKPSQLRFAAWLGPRRGATAALAVGIFAGGAIGLACIIPDQDIKVVVTGVNDFSVRFVEGIPLPEAARCACQVNQDETCGECPLPSATGLPTYLDPSDPAYQFCVCGDNKVDEGRLYGTSLFVEDQDEDDDLYAAALLDWDPTLGDHAFDYVAYRNYLDPGTPLDLFQSTYETKVILRPRPFVRSITLIDPQTQRFDLCNDAGRPVAPGVHTLSVLVTDRPWFKREGGPIGTDDDGPESMTVELQGVPDIAAGATYDFRTYVFTCQQEGDSNCDCVEP
jgi:hypothetical protein